MKPQIATTIEQSKRLLACGVDPKTADMHWCSFIKSEPFLALGELPRDNETEELMYDGDVPAWSLSALIALLPMSIRYDGFDYAFDLQTYPHEDDRHKWCASYYDAESEVSACYAEAPTPIEACVYMIEWLKNNFI